MSRWLVTGATGCVGRAVVSAALAAGHDVVGLARRFVVDLGAPVVVAPIENAAAVADVCAGRDVVVHLAGWVHRVPGSPADVAALRASIVGGTRHVARAARDAGARLIVASSVAVDHETPYGQAKLAAEAVARELVPDALILRITHVYGPHDRGNMAALARGVARGRALVVGEGANRKALIYSENLAERIVLWAAGFRKGQQATGNRQQATGNAGTGGMGDEAWGGAAGPGGTFVAADEAPTQREILDTLAAELGRRAPRAVPLGLARFAARLAGARWADRIDKLAAATEFDGRPLDERLGYRPRVAFAEGIRREVAWLRAEGHV